VAVFGTEDGLSRGAARFEDIPIETTLGGEATPTQRYEAVPCSTIC
jgi:hypothetical protein